MTQRGPSLDDLVRAHRDGLRLTGEQRERGRARVLARVAAGVAASTTIAGTAGGAASHFGWGLWAKVGIGLAVATGAGVTYRAMRPAPVDRAAIATPTASPPIAAPVVAASPEVDEPNEASGTREVQGPGRAPSTKPAAK